MPLSQKVGKRPLNDFGIGAADAVLRSSTMIIVAVGFCNDSDGNNNNE